jgi:dienelactone hydrolase
MKLSHTSWVLGMGALLLAAATQAQIKGPDPSDASIAVAGPFAVSTQTVRGSGFGGGTVYSPNTAGTYALVAFCPGFTATQSSIAVMARRLATHGFVVVTIDTNSVFDFPPSRATQLLAALNTVAGLRTGPVNGKVDSARRVVTGWSMGGGGSLLAARSTPTLRAAFGLAPYSTDSNFSSVRVPSGIVGGSADTIAPTGTHSTRFYNSINSAPALLAIIRGADHFFPGDNPANQPASKYQIAWLKRWADNDLRYTQFLDGDSRLTTFATKGF